VTPEKRAARLHDWEGATFSENDIAIIARAIRAAENAALERAAKRLESDGWHSVEAAVIRSLKTRAPRARRKT